MATKTTKSRCRDCGNEIEPGCESQVRCYLCIGKGCRIERTVLVKHGSLDLQTGEHKIERAAWETKPCGTPLFELHARETGVCKGCLDGWASPENFPTRLGEHQLDERRAALAAKGGA